ncbi:right-handed parallel beta-helix repeat-containing protein [Butyrivibrio sp. YAB3001]|uniref:right-handed parallel beta-helix repeat-containing protein n=1 Tax=Butyrivibrio sp. YAB3001 TaxID=1520812 RepID=UPI0008F681E2|nr:right-handed parallel beta-helix repeat-containing protein [Butyrivibrio sp. YAB3001]SFC62044.1 Pectate lyase superfamily protein [Butyrivibrio sp. YAB3001]
MRKYYQTILSNCLIIVLIICSMFLIGAGYQTTSDSPENTNDCIVDPESIERPAKFFLINPQEYTTNDSSVSTELCYYVGEGTVYYSGDYINSASDVYTSIKQAPDYSHFIMDGYSILWFSIYLDNDGVIVVIGKQTDIIDYNYNSSYANGIYSSSTDTAEYNSNSFNHSYTSSYGNAYVQDNNATKDDIADSYSNKLSLMSKQGSSSSYEILIAPPTPNFTSVKSYGAVGDGITDDTNAINNALKDNIGGAVYIPSGTYKVSNTLFIHSGTTLYGDGESSVIIAAPGYAIGNDIFLLWHVNDVTISNLSISGNITANTKSLGYSPLDGIHLFDIWASKNISITSCYFIDNVYAAIRIILDCSNISVDNCEFKNIDCGVITLGQGNVDTLIVQNSLFDGHLNSEPISLYGSGAYSNITIRNNTIKNKTYGSAIFCGRGKINQLTILDNKIYDDAVGIVISNATDVEIHRNIIDFSNTKYLATGGGLQISNSNKVNISNNSIFNIRQQGLTVKNCTNTDIKKNLIENCGYAGKEYHAVDFRGNCSNVNFIENTISRTDLNLSDYSLVAHCYGNLKISNNVFKNSKVLLWDDSENVYLENNNVQIRNTGTGNIIIN